MLRVLGSPWGYKGNTRCSGCLESQRSQDTTSALESQWTLRLQRPIKISTRAKVRTRVQVVKIINSGLKGAAVSWESKECVIASALCVIEQP